MFFYAEAQAQRYVGSAQTYKSSGSGKAGIEFLNLQWRNAKTEVKEAHVNESVTLRFQTRNVPDNERVTAEIWEQTGGKLLDLIAELEIPVQQNAGSADWVVALDIHKQDAHYAREIAEKGYTLIDYVFVLKYKDKTSSSKPLAILSWVYFRFLDEKTDEPIRNSKFLLYSPDGTTSSHTTDAEGYARITRLRKAGQYRVTM